MATANAGRKAAPPALRLLNGRGVDANGVARDSAGRPIPTAPAFERTPPAKPEDLSDDAAWLWDLIVDQLQRVELLKPLDAPSLEVVCETYARWKDAVRQRREKGALGENSQGVVVAPWVKIEHEAGKEFRAWCAEYGLTPAAENKVGSLGGADSGESPFG